ncbi:hypothetical protein [Streptomyces sp. NPDC048269]|uniref:effector-associated constant component EACC1 n=1 Tax=Streptomyces sp. NPDC048269 TaxID=3155753 RepID=UPI003413035D
MPELRRHLGEPPPPDAMGLGSDALIAVLAPGGVAAVLAGAVVAWVQSRRGDQTVAITTGEGTEITISTTRVRGLDARQSADLARELAAMLGAPPAGHSPAPVAATAPEPVAGTAPEPVAGHSPAPVAGTAPEPVAGTAPPGAPPAAEEHPPTRHLP